VTKSALEALYARCDIQIDTFFTNLNKHVSSCSDLAFLSYFYYLLVLLLLLSLSKERTHIRLQSFATGTLCKCFVQICRKTLCTACFCTTRTFGLCFGSSMYVNLSRLVASLGPLTRKTVVSDTNSLLHTVHLACNKGIYQLYNAGFLDTDISV